MRIIICDDNQAIISQLSDYIQEFYRLKKLTIPEIVSYSDGHTLLDEFSSCDIMFLDIEMPEINGILIGNTISKKYPNIKIFVITSYMEYLDDAMRFHVYRYLSKPIDKQRLFRNLSDVINERNEPICEKKITLSFGGKTSIIKCINIIYVEALRHKTKVVTTDGEILSNKSMTFWINHLTEEYFYQTNRSFIVNLNYISDFEHDTVYLCKKKYNVLLTNRKYGDFKRIFYRYIEKKQ